MDERIKKEFRKIYSELFQIVLVVCCLSVIIKTTFLGMNAGECIPEFPIMIGSPIYLAIRSRMLGISQISEFQDKGSKTKRTALLAGVFGFVLVFAAQSAKRGEALNLPAVIGSCIIFIVCFLGIYKFFYKIEKRRQDRLDSRYDE